MSKASISAVVPNSAPSAMLGGMPLDQAHGLRQLFSGHRARFVPVVSNPHIGIGGLMLERLCTAFSTQGARTLVIDAGERSTLADAAVLVDLASAIEHLSPQVAYLAARGLPQRCIDAEGFTSAFLDCVSDATGDIDVAIVHAPGADLCRMFARHDPRHAATGAVYPLLLCDDRPTSVTHAYGALKILAQRAGLLVHDVLLGAAPESPRAARIADRLAACAELYLQATVRHAMRVDPVAHASEPAPPDLQRWAQQWLSSPGLSAATRPLGPSGAAVRHILN
ncbi:MAG: flagellar biosynthesis protein [Burkholderiales bacterium]|jgi:flagellar biosynthesis protein FlhG|nr:flagellar biosynthesis protein [Burkholderiales bacterium]